MTSERLAVLADPLLACDELPEAGDPPEALLPDEEHAAASAPAVSRLSASGSAAVPFFPGRLRERRMIIGFLP